MRGKLVVLGFVLCALPASGAEPTEIENHTLSPIDELPTKDEIITLAGPDPVPRLRELALSQLTDFGVQLRAIRALPQFCTPTCKQINVTDPPHPARDAVLAVIASVQVPPTGRTGREIVRLRAGIEALGLVRSGAQSDIDLLLVLLDDTSRDVRVAVALALKQFCAPSARLRLVQRHDDDSVRQVQLAIEDALQHLDTCTPP